MVKNYPPCSDDYDSEEEYEQAVDAYWDMVDRKYDDFKQDKLDKENNLFMEDKTNL